MDVDEFNARLRELEQWRASVTTELLHIKNSLDRIERAIENNNANAEREREKINGHIVWMTRLVVGGIILAAMAFIQQGIPAP